MGTGQTFGRCLMSYFDDQFARAAAKCFVSAEELVDRLDLSHPEDARANLFERYLVTGVTHAPFGAHPTSFPTRYGADWTHIKAYAASAAEEDGWDKYVAEFIAGGEADYLQKVGGADREVPAAALAFTPRRGSPIASRERPNSPWPSAIQSWRLRRPFAAMARCWPPAPAAR